MYMPRPVVNVIANSDHGMMIVNRNDYCGDLCGAGYGVGHQILTNSHYDPKDVELLLFLLKSRHELFGPGVVALDCGANIGVHTIEWSKALTYLGEVISFEPQRHIFHALCGNIAINNCFNVRAYMKAVGSEATTIEIPEPDYTRPGSFGSLELIQTEKSENIGQDLDGVASVEQITIDSLELERCDLIKIDVEGMECSVIDGATETIDKHKPIMFIEVIKVDRNKMRTLIESKGYAVMDTGMNFLCIHESDATSNKLKIQGGSNVR